MSRPLWIYVVSFIIVIISLLGIVIDTRRQTEEIKINQGYIREALEACHKANMQELDNDRVILANEDKIIAYNDTRRSQNAEVLAAQKTIRDDIARMMQEHAAILAAQEKQAEALARCINLWDEHVPSKSAH